MHRSLSTYCPPLRGPPPEGYLPWALATTTCLAAASSNLAEGWPTMCAGGWSLKIWVPVQICPDEVGYKWDYLSNIDILWLRPSRPSYEFPASAYSWIRQTKYPSISQYIPVVMSIFVNLRSTHVLNGYSCIFKIAAGNSSEINDFVRHPARSCEKSFRNWGTFGDFSSGWFGPAPAVTFKKWRCHKGRGPVGWVQGCW